MHPILIGMKNTKVQKQLKQLLRQYPGGKVEKYDSLANDLHIKRRWLIYLLKGEKTPGFYLSREISNIHFSKCGCPYCAKT